VRITLILPGQKSVYSNLYEVYADLNNALLSLGIESKIILVKEDEYAKFPFGNVDMTDFSGLSDIFEENHDKNAVFLTVDDHPMMRWLSKRKRENNLIIWAHYLYGQRFVFPLYRNAKTGLQTNMADRANNLFTSWIPNALAIRASAFYRRTLNMYPVFAQSLWTGLMLERMLSVPVLGTLLIPVERRLYEFPMQGKREGVLVFLGNASDTDLNALNKTLMMLGSDEISNIDYFGDRESGEIFEKKFGREMNFIGKVERRELLKEYSEHELTISPVFNGTFEMVPVQSLLCGTPVISFNQPFMEVTGESDMIANIHNAGEIRTKVQIWKSLTMDARQRMKNIIFEKMESKKVAENLLYQIRNLGFH
jgi:glycosyltransferase involved in cell wall biosynthesis